MATPYHLQRVCAAYVSDDTITYQVGLSLDNQTAGGFATALPGENPSYPRGWVMRHVYGKDTSGNRSKLPIASPSNSLFTDGGSFTKNGTSFTVEGKIGEKRMNKGI
jgi:hypothetical protein